MSLLWLVDVLDIAIVAFIFYKLLVMVRGTRAFQMFIGLSVIFVLSFVSKILQMNALNWLFSGLQTVWLVAFVVLFQPELRRALSQAGQHRLYRRLFRVETRETVDEVIKAVQELAARRTGSLIVLRRSANLRNYVETGSRLDARVSAELLLTLFMPRTPLHDGAVIIEEDRILAAGCILPLSQSETVSRSLGTRHRAAIGLTEETDALVLVSSEESGRMSLARRGRLVTYEDTAALRDDLRRMFASTD
jgi:diadenylate cyclase